MLLAPEKDVRLALGVADNERYNETIRQFLLGATFSLTASLRTEFDRVTHADVFYVRESQKDDDSIYYDRPRQGRAWTVDGQLRYVGDQPRTRLLLSQGFVDSAQAISIRSAGTIGGLTDSSVFTDLTSAEGVDTVIAYEQGGVQVWNADLSGYFVRVEYTAGFDTTAGTDPPLYDQTQVPKWLQRLAQITALMSLTTHPLFTESNKSAEFGAKALHAQAQALIAKHVRYAPSALRPLR